MAPWFRRLRRLAHLVQQLTSSDLDLRGINKVVVAYNEEMVRDLKGEWRSIFAKMFHGLKPAASEPRGKRELRRRCWRSTARQFATGYVRWGGFYRLRPPVLGFVYRFWQVVAGTRQSTLGRSYDLCKLGSGRVAIVASSYREIWDAGGGGAARAQSTLGALCLLRSVASRRRDLQGSLKPLNS